MPVATNSAKKKFKLPIQFKKFFFLSFYLFFNIHQVHHIFNVFQLDMEDEDAPLNLLTWWSLGGDLG